MILLLMLMIWTLTVAALFRYDLLLILFLFEAALLAASLILPRIISRHLSVKIPHAAIGHIGKDAVIPAAFSYAGKLPLPEIRVVLKTERNGAERRTFSEMSGSRTSGTGGIWLHIFREMPSGRTKGKKINLSVLPEEPGIHASGKNGTMVLRAGTPHFGVVHAKVRGIRVYDYLKLFHVTMHLNRNLDLFVLPEDRHVGIVQDTVSGEGEQGDLISPAEGMDEVSDIRDFREGDRLRDVSWKQAARFDHLMTKEYARTVLPPVRIRAVLPAAGAGPEEWDRSMQALQDQAGSCLHRGRTVVLETEPDGRTTILHTSEDLQKYFVPLCRERETILCQAEEDDRGSAKGIGRTGRIQGLFRTLSIVLFLLLLADLSVSAVIGRAVSLAVPAATTGICAALAALAALRDAAPFFIKRGRSGKRDSSEKNRIPVVVAGTVLFFLMLIIPAAMVKEPLYRLVYRVKSVVSKGENAAQFNPTGEINRGNLYPSDAVIADLWTDTIPTEPMYLKNFTGSTYQNGVWESAAAQEEEILTHVIPRPDKNTMWYSWIRNMFRTMYLRLNADTDYFGRPANIHYLTITGEGLQDSDIPVPYYATMSYQESSETFTADRVFYGYLERHEITVPLDQETGDENRDETLRWYEEMEQLYVRQIGVYTEVDETALPGLAAWVREHPAESEEEAVQNVLSLLSEQEYSLTPGHVPYGEDPSEYFVTDSHLGYCQQFASTAVLLLRMYGIPARYAAGYRLDPADFSEEGVGIGAGAELSQLHAHAWAEIFEENYGWVPLEVTPDAAGVIRAQIPDGRGFALSSFASLPSGSRSDSLYHLPVLFAGRDGENEGNSAAEGEAGSGTSVSGAAPEQEAGENAAADSPAVRLRNLFIIMMETILLYLPVLYTPLTGAFRAIRRHRLLHMTDVELARRVMKRLKKRGLPSDYNGQEKDFAGRAAEILNDSDERRGRLLRDILLRLSFSEEKCAGQEEKGFLTKLVLEL